MWLPSGSEAFAYTSPSYKKVPEPSGIYEKDPTSASSMENVRFVYVVYVMALSNMQYA